ncbi:Purine nucleoside phosphorylase [Coemansia sp. RSA 1813]|nr:Purine nucleoside phosphorylase [Coemansia sp. RSA 1646]KAJ1770670.1 Purine nucleoside phosphorylase [Coemansia sp. RSA 1843]KAJ2087320.1 Purine nucleoside phosphorylase [Coemansia sp. RSA 986]KAJ2215716.1 Purine nucleoside phosphorylase [Coemansia sp. RSA 487]KAJ2568462.1 Purine nucleoside phosphorylase [Coemansia sp. RSA 1813]
MDPLDNKSTTQALAELCSPVSTIATGGGSSCLSPRPVETIPHSVYESAANYVRTKLKGRELPQIGLICGKTLQGLADKLEGEIVDIPHTEIPGFVSSTVLKSTGRLVFGEISGTPVVCIVGRCHYYEGYSMKHITFPIRMLSLIGVKTLIITTAVSGVASDLDLGDITVIKDHISLPTLAGLNPLIGPNFAQLGPRMPSMYNAYTFNMRKLAFKVLLSDQELQKRGVRMREAIYCHTTGPSFETRAECFALRSLGAEVIGTSIVPDIIVAHHSGLDVLCLGLVTNVVAKGDEPCAEEAARAALAGTKAPKPKDVDADDDILARKGSVKKGSQRAADLNLLVKRMVETM